MKENNKRIALACSLALLMCFGIVGCGSNNKSNTSQETSQKQESEAFADGQVVVDYKTMKPI